VEHLGASAIQYNAYPRIQSVLTTVENIPKIAAWIAKRPQTEK
jgi:hypothetical protein